MGADVAMSTPAERVDRSGTVVQADPSIVLQPGEGRDISLSQHRQRKIVVKADERGTGGAYRLMESTVPPGGSGAPPHYHGRAEEGFYVLEGALSMRVGERELSAATGTFVLVPHGLVHSFDNLGAVAARYLVIWSPAEAGRYFEELFELERASGGKPGAAAIGALRKKYDFVYL
jgi:mannose-6-phosphate isomerase-like protein (cupin superfamily)